MLRDASASPDPEVARLFMDKVLPVNAPCVKALDECVICAGSWPTNDAYLLVDLVRK